MKSFSLRMSALPRRRRILELLMLALLAAPQALAQQVADAAPGAPELPDQPKAAPPAPPLDSAPAPPVEDKRIMGVLPNYRTADGTLPFHPISNTRKLTIAAKDSFDGPNY